MAAATNGASLENCHTNVFALTELHGLQWKRFAVARDGDLNIKESDLLSDGLVRDPVLLSYGRCLTANLLTAWKRVPSSNPNLPVRKKLWVFWYGEEPELHQMNLLSPELSEEECGGWSTGLTYECRMLLFRALHTLIERCLLTHRFVRLGKWFVQPHDVLTAEERQLRYSYSFEFFLHGESTVCLTVDVKIHPQLMRLSKSHLAGTAFQANSGTKTSVILCPYGLSGIFTGNFVSTEKSKQLFQQWKQFFPMDLPEKTDNHSSPGDASMNNPATPHDISAGAPSPNPATPNPQSSPDARPVEAPFFVEIIVADVRMMYPSTFVLLVDDEALSQSRGKVEFGEKSSAPPLVSDLPVFSGVASGKLLQKQCLAKISRDNSGKRDGVSGLPKSKREQERVLVRSTLNSLFQDMSVTRKKSSDKSARTISVADVTTVKIGDDQPAFGLLVPNIVDPAEKKTCDCDASRPIIDAFPAPRSSSPTSSPTNYSVQGLGLIALKVKAAQEQPKQDSISSEASRNQSFSFHRRGLPLSARNGGPSHVAKQGLSSKGVRNNGDGLKPPATPVSRGYGNSRTAFSGVMSPGAYCNTPQSQLSSVMQMSPVSSPASMSQSIPSPMTPITPFVPAPRTPKTPRSVGPRSVAVGERELVPPSPLHPASVEQPRSVQPIRSTFLAEMQNKPPVVEIVSSIKGLKRPRLGDFFEKEEDAYDKETAKDDTDGFGFSFSPGPGMEDVDWALLESSSAKKQKIFHPSYEAENAFFPETLTIPQFPVTQPDAKISVKTAMAPETTFTKVEVDVSKEKLAMNFANFPGTIGPLELSRMFPTPPSMENQPTCSPLDMHRDLEEQAPVVEASGSANVLVFSLQSSKYSPLNNLSSPPVLPDKLLYRPPWILKSTFQHAPRKLTAKIRTPGGAGSTARLQQTAHRSPRATNPFGYPVPGQMVPALRPPMFPQMGSRPRSAPDPSMQFIQNQQHSVGPFDMMPSPAPGQFSPPSVLDCPALLLNVLLSDSLLNFFADKNFEGCIICVCNQSIKSRDCSGFHTPATFGVSDDGKCSCGFSAVVNRRHGFRTGLFYEDEVDITGVSDLPLENLNVSLAKLLDLSLSQDQEAVVSRIPDPVLILLKHTAGNPFLSSNSLLRNYLVYKNARNFNHRPGPRSGLDLQLDDMNRICSGLLELCKISGVDPGMPPRLLDILPSQQLCRQMLHPWLVNGHPVKNSADVVRVQRMVQPMLQEAVQLRRLTRLWDKVFTVEGPLTWKDFLRFADTNGMEDQKIPLAIPSWLVGFEKEWMRISPTAFAHWEKMAFEPYGAKRDVVYAILTPDSDYVCLAVKSFFRDLSKTYELCGLGRHSPMPKLADGLLTARQSRVQDKPQEHIDEWFRYIGSSAVADRLRLYAMTCRIFLGPHIQIQKNEGSITQLFAPPPPAPLRVLPESGGTVGGDVVSGTGYVSSNSSSGPSSQNPSTGSAHSTQGLPMSILTTTLPNYPLEAGYLDKDETHPLVVIYMVDPFALTLEQNWEGVQRLASIGLLRSYQEVLKALSEDPKLRDNVVLQIVPIDTVLGHSVAEPVSGRSGALRSLALSVYAQNQRKIPATEPTKMLTGFGPATAFRRWLEERRKMDMSAEKKIAEMSAYTPPYILSSGREKKMDLMEIDNKDRSTTLLVAYCLSEDQKWILASCTDARGEILETQVINVFLPNRIRRKGMSIMRYSLRKLWDFVVGVMSKLIGPCRLVIGRVGRLGHGELKVWSSVLSKKSLARAGQQLRQLCEQCNSKLMGSLEMPNILSACLVSLLPESSFRVAADSFSHDERIPSAAALSRLSSPEDVTCTHIYVFPTSATAQPQGLPGIAGDEHMEEELLLNNLDTEGLHDAGDNVNVMDGLDFSDLFSGFGENVMNSPAGSPKGGDMRPLSPTSGLKHSDVHIGAKSAAIVDEPGQLLQQPLAVGYLVSTARIGPMPRWFFTATDQDENSCPIVLKSALHIHSAHVLHGEEMYSHSSHNTRTSHPLDSGLTADVLKHVLENYNALSWLVMDPGSQDRRSCLPHHIQVLMQLYFAAAAIL